LRYSRIVPRKARIDAAALRRLIVRGIEGRAIVRDDVARERFLERLAKLLSESKTSCCAWAILPNHIHFLVRTGIIPVAKFMAGLLTGCAASFNKRHRRRGRLFQNRYKSILCEEDPYFLELVSYIHLNPLRAGIVDSMEELDGCPCSGRSALVHVVERERQDAEYVLASFGAEEKTAQGLYRAFVAQGISQGRRRDLSGGGAMRSNQGWKAPIRDSVRPKGDERILGQSSFVLGVLKSADEA